MKENRTCIKYQKRMKYSKTALIRSIFSCSRDEQYFVLECLKYLYINRSHLKRVRYWKQVL